MSLTLGIDTSNYTTSVAVFDTEKRGILQSKKLLPVGSGEAGLRQSDAVFAHVKQLSEVFSGLDVPFKEISAVGVSVSPRDADGSYMPCFLVGKMLAECIARILSVPLSLFSHQAGHIAAAAFSAGKTDLLKRRFAAFHVSGGTTEVLLVSPDKEKILRVEIFGKTLDLNAGQLIDRVGLMLSLNFPAGIALDRLSLQSNQVYNIRPSLRGNDCCLSGAQNKCREMLEKGEKPCDVARLAVDTVRRTVEGMYRNLIREQGALPVVFAGGVMSNTIIREYFKSTYGDVYFADPVYSSDNAAGIALLAGIKECGE